MDSRRIYLDYAATTPVDRMVLRAMQPYFQKRFGNAGSLHSFGQEAVAALDAARGTVAHAIGASFREIIFTGSATEANNLAIRGVVSGSGIARPKIIVSSIEHESVLETAKTLERSHGAEVVYLPVDQQGVVDLERLRTALDERTVLISILYANNEIGTVQPITEIIKLMGDFYSKVQRRPLFHTDASQAFQFFDCDVRSLGVDLMTLSSHKIYGPKGAGALYARGQKSLEPLIMGGGQEFGFRSGTENIPAIVGFAEAMRIAVVMRKKETRRIGELRDYLWRGIKRIYPRAKVNGVDREFPDDRRILPNMVNVYFSGHKAQDLLTELDLRGLAVSSGSACRARATEPSYVIEALGFSRARAESSVRFSLGRPTRRGDISGALEILKRELRR